ncbi:glycosyltransferase [Halorubrum sp. SD690R]|uniref:glycosyltransferase family 4 protein n=1 Tax=Halorubrum sp. SD690R TaxID=2518117 RepID=UPI0010F66C33|nr:glycosyltransferase family 4 protein [Halorubrum sp. SD690R]TKX47244.1 glycosyltransferase [Halorubrum sp. SD690R]
MKEQYDSVTDFVEDLPRDINSVAICGTSYTDTGGVARVIEQQATELAGNGFDVEINTLIGDKDPPENVTLHTIGRFETTPYKEVDKLLVPLTPSGWRFVSRMNDVDLIISHRFPFSVLSFFSARTQDETTYVFWSHPSQSSEDLFDGVAKIWAKLQHHLETAHFTVSKADYLCAVSEASQSYIASKTGRDPIYVPNSIPESRFSEVASRETIETRYDISPDDTVVLHVGRITPRKSIDKLVESFERIKNGCDGYKLVLVGKENMDEYGDTVREKASEDVILTGFVEDEILAGFYERSNVYATCSLSEGWGLPLSEANRFGTTIVAYDSIPAVRSIENTMLATDGDQTDFEAKLKDAIKESKTNNADREQTKPHDIDVS